MDDREEKVRKKCAYNLLIILLFTCLYQLMRLYLCEWERKNECSHRVKNSKLKTIIEIRRSLIIIMTISVGSRFAGQKNLFLFRWQ